MKHDSGAFSQKRILHPIALNWHILPQRYPDYKTVHRRFQQWCRNKVLRDVVVGLANALRDEGMIDESECFIDATFTPASGGGGSHRSKRGNGVKIMAIVDRHGAGLDVTTVAGWLNDSLRGCNGKVGSWFDGNTMPGTS